MSYKVEKLDNGREKCRAVLRENKSLALKIENEIRAKLGYEPKKGSAAPAAAAPAVAPAPVAAKPAVAPPAKAEDKKPVRK